MIKQWNFSLKRAHVPNLQMTTEKRHAKLPLQNVIFETKKKKENTSYVLKSLFVGKKSTMKLLNSKCYNSASESE